MKKLFAIVLFLSLAGCSDFLDEENKTDVLADELYSTPSGYEQLVNTAYAGLRNIYSTPWMFEAGTDLHIEGRDAQPEGVTEYKSLTPDDPTVEEFYKECYVAIQRCNVGIYYNDITEQTQVTAVRLGELKFLRAYYYFLLVQTFGGVTIVEDPITSPVTSFDRQNAEAVYNFIVTEMEEALELTAESPEAGRVSKRAVKHYLAKVHLTRGYETFAMADDFQRAAEYADDAINGYDLSSLTFTELFWPGNENNSEVLFSIQYDAGSLEFDDETTNLVLGSSQGSHFGPYHGGEGQAQGYPSRRYNLIATKYAYDLFTENDARWEGTFMNVFYSRYYDFYDKSESEKEDLAIRFYYPQAWEVEDTVAWRAADPEHRSNTRIIPYEINEDGLSLTWETATGTDNNIPAIRKFDDPTAPFGHGTSGRDIILARLAETYLIAAEAYFQLDDKLTAMDRLNEVRERAEEVPGSLVLNDPNTVTIDFILDERARELMGEYHRWFDLKRTGELKERVLMYNRDVRGIASPFVGPDGNDKILRPIPQSALDLNENKDYSQNDGYIAS